MTAPHDSPDDSLSRRGISFWLPPHGFGNGLTASAWDEIADLREIQLAEVLFALAQAGIAGHVAQLDRKPTPYSGPVRYRLWVDSLRYLHAEHVLMEVLRGS